MNERTLILKVDNGKEFYLKTIIDLLSCVNSSRIGKGWLEVYFDNQGECEKNSLKQIISNLYHVNSIKELNYNYGIK